MTHFLWISTKWVQWASSDVSLRKDSISEAKPWTAPQQPYFFCELLWPLTKSHEEPKNLQSYLQPANTHHGWKLRKSQCKISEKIRGCQQFLLWSLVNLEAFTYFRGSVGAAPTQALACFSRQHGEIPPRCDIEFHPPKPCMSNNIRISPLGSSKTTSYYVHSLEPSELYPETHLNPNQVHQPSTKK